MIFDFRFMLFDLILFAPVISSYAGNLFLDKHKELIAQTVKLCVHSAHLFRFCEMACALINPKVIERSHSAKNAPNSFQHF